VSTPSGIAVAWCYLITPVNETVDNMRILDDKIELFKAFADVENEFKTLEVSVHDLVAQINHNMQIESDVQRDKLSPWIYRLIFE
jgi:hypothetical protein